MVIDTLNGYLNAMPGEKYLTNQLHELITYLNYKGVVTILILAQHGLVAAAEVPGRPQLPVGHCGESAILRSGRRGETIDSGD